MLTLPKLPVGQSGIYLIQNNETKQFYVGGSTNLRSRLVQHKNDLANDRAHNRRFQKDYDKYGADSFSVRVLLRCKVDELLHYEQRMFDLFKRHYPSYHKGKDVDVPSRGATRPDMVGTRTLNEWRWKAQEVWRERMKNDPDMRRRVAEAGRKVMKRMKANPEIEARRKRLAAEAQRRPELKELKRKQMLERWANGWKPRSNPHKLKVINRETGEIFDSLTSAAEHMGVRVCTMHVWIKGKKNANGKRYGKKPEWDLYEEESL